MNVIGAGALSPADLASMKAEARSIIADTDVAVSVAYAPKGAPRTYDPNRGIVDYGGTPSTFTAWMGPAEEEDGEVAAGDVALLISTTDVADPELDDQLVVDGARMFLVRVTPTVAGFARVLARRVP